jgi:RNA polymerase sigma-70 factor (ECF subfamily)
MDRDVTPPAAHFGSDGGRDFDTLLAKLRAHMLRTLRRRRIEPNLAEDIVQEGLALVWRKLPQLRDRERLRSWATSIVLNRLRSQRSRHRLVEEVSEERPGNEPSPLDALVRAELGRTVDDLLSDLKPEQRAALALRHANGLSVEAASAALGISRLCLRRRVHAGLARMRRRLPRVMSSIPAPEPAWRFAG